MEDTVARPPTNRANPLRLPGAAVIVFGAILALSSVIELWVGVKAENVSDLVRPEMTDSGLAQHRADFESASRAVHGLNTEVLPALAQSAGITPANLRTLIDANYPSAAKFLASESQVIPFAESSLVNLERQQAHFQNADSAPTGWLPAYAEGVLDIVLAAIVLACGLLLVRTGKGSGRIPVLALGATAAVLIVLPLVLRAPGKASDAQAVLDSLNPTQAVVTRTEDSLRLAHEATTEFNTRLVPGLSAALGTTPAGFQAAIARQSPATAAALQELPAVLERYDARLAIRVGGAEDIRFLTKLPIGPLGWFGPVFGLVLAAATGWAWFASRRG